MKQVLITALAALTATSALAAGDVIVSTPAYTWHGDTITQGVYMATAPNDTMLVSTYMAQPGYYMGIDKQWNKRNDLSQYPQLRTPNTLHRAIYNLGLDEMVNAVEPDTTLRTGKEWAGVWTRDVSYSILLSMAYMQPEATRISLMRKVDPLGRIIQDTGSGGAYPVSTDRMIWAVAAYELYLVTGDREWLKTIYPIIKRSLYDDRDNGLYTDNGLVRGETSFIDWREQSYPKWMQTADIYQSEALGTSVVHARAWQVLADIAADLGHKDVAADAQAQADRMAAGINNTLWLDDKGYYAMYTYGRDNLIANPRAETLGEALSIVWDIAPADRAKRLSSSNPTTPFGVGIFYPQIADMPPYHNNALWPWVGAWWGIASAKAGNEDGVMQAIGSVFRPAALFTTNKENFVLDNGDIATELNSSNMLWCLSGNIALTHKILFGIDFTRQGLAFRPFVPKAMDAERTLDNFGYRGARLNITVSGYGDSIASFRVDGREQAPLITPKQAARAAKSGKPLDIRIVMCNQPIAPLPVNNVPNVKAPLTPITRIEGGHLVWQPLEYINTYNIIRDGKLIDTVHTTQYTMTAPGEYQVIAVSDAGVPGFASEPLSNRLSYSFQMPAEVTEISSPEAVKKYLPHYPIVSYNGRGFAEVDQKTADITVPVTVPQAGTYALTLRYANGNGPVNTENRCAIRTILVNGQKAGIAVMPQRGRANWSDWGTTNSIDVDLPAGESVITITYQPSNINMNRKTNHALIDQLTLTLKK